jgi:hypothetical protein
MKTLDHNAISRSLHLLAYQIPDRQYAKRHEGDTDKLQEMLEQHQIDISGTAGLGDFTDAKILFQNVLYYAPQERTIATEDPQFTHGLVLDTGDVAISVHVRQWLLDESANYYGAILRIGAIQQPWAPGSVYSGTVHVTFQGLGLPVEDPGYDDTP